MLSHVRLLQPPGLWPLGSSVHRFSRQEYWSGVPFPAPRDLFIPGIKLTSLMSSTLAGRFFTISTTWEALSPVVFIGSGGLVAKSCPSLVTPWTVACQAPLSMGFFRQEYWSGVPFSLSGDLPDPGVKPMSLASPALAGRVFTSESSGKSKEAEHQRTD